MKLAKCRCGDEARWCGENNPNPDDDHECHQIQCDHCGIHFDVYNDETQQAETLDELREIVLRAWNTESPNTYTFASEEEAKAFMEQRIDPEIK